MISARLRARSRSSMSSERISLARAAVSHRHPTDPDHRTRSHLRPRRDLRPREWTRHHNRRTHHRHGRLHRPRLRAVRSLRPQVLTPHPRHRRPAPLATPHHPNRHTRRRAAPSRHPTRPIPRPLGRSPARFSHDPTVAQPRIAARRATPTIRSAERSHESHPGIRPGRHEHINFLGRYDFNQPTSPPDGQLRPLRT